MAWVKSDDRMDDTPKVKKAWRRNRASVGLWKMAKTCSARHEADGLVLLEWVEEKLPEATEREDVLTVLLDIGLFEKLPAGETKRVKVTRVRKGKQVDVKVTYGPCAEDAFIVHDYLEFNEARVEAEERRRIDAERKTKERGGKGPKSPSDDDGSSASRPPGQSEDSAGTDEGLHAVSTSPDPTRPDPTRTQSLRLPPDPPRGGRVRDREKWEKEFASWLEANPVTQELLAEWEPAADRLAEVTGDQYVMSQLGLLHPHSFADGIWLLGGPETPTLSMFRHFAESASFKATVGFDWELVDCGCELSRECAA